MNSIYFSKFECRVGRLLLVGDDAGLRTINFQVGKRPIEPHADWTRSDEAFTQVREQLTAYFQGDLLEFDLPLRPSGTEFQMDVWQELLNIPYGETISYGELAGRIGRPKASRAVGAANGANPLPIVVPCHRVIGASGKLTGFGGGLPNKVILLDLEREHAPEAVFQATSGQAQHPAFL